MAPKVNKKNSSKAAAVNVAAAAPAGAAVAKKARKSEIITNRNTQALFMAVGVPHVSKKGREYLRSLNTIFLNDAINGIMSCVGTNKTVGVRHVEDFLASRGKYI